MTPANPPAPSAQALFFRRLHALQPRSRKGRISTWPFKVTREQGHEQSQDADSMRRQAARVIRTTAESWWPSDS